MKSEFDWSRWLASMGFWLSLTFLAAIVAQ
jgi:hypothetical protein